MKPLISVMGCNARNAYIVAQRQTWAVSQDIDIKFFIGGVPQRQALPDEIFANCRDDYKGLPSKIQEAVRWALNNNYTNIWKCDDDTYARPERLLIAAEADKQYIGCYRQPTHGYPAGWCAGGPGYWLNQETMDIIANAIIDDDAEDRFISKALFRKDIVGEHDNRYKLVMLSKLPELPKAGNNIISACEFTPDQMHVVHDMWTKSVNRRNDFLERIKL